jgi:hypothetical protein
MCPKQAELITGIRIAALGNSTLTVDKAGLINGTSIGTPPGDLNAGMKLGD